MTWKEAFKVIFHLFTFITALQLLFIFFIIEFRGPYLNPEAEFNHRFILQVFLLAAATSFPTLVLVGSEMPKPLEFWVRRLVHCALSVTFLVGMLIYFRWFAVIPVILSAIAFIVVYLISTTLLHKENVRIAEEINRSLMNDLNDHASLP